MADSDAISPAIGATERRKAVIPAAALAALATFVAGSVGGYFLAPSLIGSTAAISALTTNNSDKTEAATSVGHAPSTTGAKKVGPKALADKGCHEEKDCCPECGSEFRIVGDSLYYTPPAFLVSIRPGGPSRRLKIAIAVETAPEAQATISDASLRIKDALTQYLRLVDPSTLDDPDAFQELRSQLARRISTVVAPAPVRAILITEFILI